MIYPYHLQACVIASTKKVNSHTDNFIKNDQQIQHQGLSRTVYAY